jgi:hypothetical protein
MSGETHDLRSSIRATSEGATRAPGNVANAGTPPPQAVMIAATGNANHSLFMVSGVLRTDATSTFQPYALLSTVEET